MKGAPNYVLKHDVCIPTDIRPTELLITPFNTNSPLVELNTLGLLKVNTNYAWDGSKVIMDTKINMLASLVHDALYQLMSTYCTTNATRIGGISRSEFRKKADLMYLDLYRQNGATGLVGKLWSSLTYIGIRLFGWIFSCKRKTKSYWGMEMFSETCKAPAKGADDCPNQHDDATE